MGREFPETASIDDKYGPAMEITGPDEAVRYFARLCHDPIADGMEEDYCKRTEFSNLVQYAALRKLSKKIQTRVQTLYEKARNAPLMSC